MPSLEKNFHIAQQNMIEYGTTTAGHNQLSAPNSIADSPGQPNAKLGSDKLAKTQ